MSLCLFFLRSLPPYKPVLNLDSFFDFFSLRGGGGGGDGGSPRGMKRNNRQRIK